MMHEFKQRTALRENESNRRKVNGDLSNPTNYGVPIFSPPFGVWKQHHEGKNGQ